MFTGIVTDLGRVRSVERRDLGEGGDSRFVLETAYDTGTIEIGASIACSGACLTVVEKGPGWFAVDVSAETLACTTLGAWQPGRPVNLERSLTLKDELGGHLVLGHVDGVGQTVAREPEGDSLRFTFLAPAEIAGLIAAKGSIAVDGVSLTVNQVEDQADGGARFGINIIPHTAQVTSLGGLAPGDPVNLEIDLVARYLQRFQQRAG
ncbi:MAG: riboflavin synthase [Pseudomonadota bacterium]